MIDHQKGKSLPKPVDVRSFNRPFKAAFIVPFDESQISHWILDAVFAESYARWGGDRSVIVPVEGDSGISETYLKWIEQLDPDLIYTYVDLSQDLVESLNRRALPIEFRRHSEHQATRWRDFLPNWGPSVKPVPALSTIGSPSAGRSGRSGQKLTSTYVTQYVENDHERHLPDNFGVHALLGVAFTESEGIFDTLCLTHDTVPACINVGTYRESNLEKIIDMIARGDVTTFSALAPLHVSGIPEQESNGWSNSTHLLVGDSIADRVYFWNIRHFGPRWAGASETNCIRVSPEFISNDSGRAAIKKVACARSAALDQGRPRIAVTSYSRSAEECEEIAQKLRDHDPKFAIVERSRMYGQVPLPETDNGRIAGLPAGEAIPPFKLRESKNVIAATEPHHFRYLPGALASVCHGQWMVDLHIERHNDTSRVVNVFNDWCVPRRVTAVRAFSDNPARVTRDHHLSIATRMRRWHPLSTEPAFQDLHIKLPEDAEVFAALATTPLPLQYQDYRERLNQSMYGELRISDKGKLHRGLVSRFHDIQDAASVLTNRFWRELIRCSLTERYSSCTMEQLESRINGIHGSELARIVEEGRYDSASEVKRWFRAQLHDTLQELVESGVMIQFYEWSCNYCGTKNRRSLDTLHRRNDCEVCEAEHWCPIGFEWKYAFAGFVTNTLMKQSGLPVVWAIPNLVNSIASLGWFYLPEVDLYREVDKPDTKHEVDFLAVIDGKYIAGEVKTTMRPIEEDATRLDSFVDKVNTLQPDRAVLAFEAYDSDRGEEAGDVTHAMRREALVNTIESQVPSNVEVEVRVAEDDSDYVEYSHDLGYFGVESERFVLERGNR